MGTQAGGSGNGALRFWGHSLARVGPPALAMELLAYRHVVPGQGRISRHMEGSAVHTGVGGAGVGIRLLLINLSFPGIPGVYPWRDQSARTDEADRLVMVR